MGGPCAQYQGDLLDFRAETYQGITPSFALRLHRLALLGFTDPCTGIADGRAMRVDPVDATFLKLWARGNYEPIHASNGLCTSAPPIDDAIENYPAVTTSTCAAIGIQVPDGGSLYLPSASYRDSWSGLRVLNTARFPGTVWEAKVAIYREDYGLSTCSAEYRVTGFRPVVPCSSVWGDSDCTSPDAGIDQALRPKCVVLARTTEYVYEFQALGGAMRPWTNGVCVPSLTLDELAALR